MSLPSDLLPIHRLHEWDIRHSECTIVFGLIIAIVPAIGNQASPAGWLRRLSRSPKPVFVSAFLAGALILAALMLIGLIAGFCWQMPETGMVFGIYLGSLTNVALGLLAMRTPSVMSRLKPSVALEADPSDHRWWEGVTWGSRNTSFG
jgi:hypothetical protein